MRDGEDEPALDDLLGCSLHRKGGKRSNFGAFWTVSFSRWQSVLRMGSVIHCTFCTFPLKLFQLCDRHRWFGRSDTNTGMLLDIFAFRSTFVRCEEGGLPFFQFLTELFQETLRVGDSQCKAGYVHCGLVNLISKSRYILKTCRYMQRSKARSARCGACGVQTF